MECQNDSVENAANVRMRSDEIFVSSEDIPSLSTNKDFEQGDVKGNADSDIDSTMVRRDLAEGVAAVSVRKLEVKTPTVLS